MLAAYGRAVEGLGGRYVTAEDVGMSVADMVALSKETRHVAGLPVAEGSVGGDPGPHTSYGVFLGVKAAVKRALGKDSLAGVHIALQGAGSVASGLARRAAAEGARITLTDIDRGRAEALAREVGGETVAPEAIMTLEADVLSPNALGAILTEESIAALKVPVVAGGANNQLATPADGQRIHQRGILYAPDYVINAGGIINVSTEYLKDGDEELVRERIEQIPVRLDEIWSRKRGDRPQPGRGRRRDGDAADRALTRHSGESRNPGTLAFSKELLFLGPGFRRDDVTAPPPPWAPRARAGARGRACRGRSPMMIAAPSQVVDERLVGEDQPAEQHRPEQLDIVERRHRRTGAKRSEAVRQIWLVPPTAPNASRSSQVRPSCGWAKNGISSAGGGDREAG